MKIDLFCDFFGQVLCPRRDEDTIWKAFKMFQSPDKKLASGKCKGCGKEMPGMHLFIFLFEFECLGVVQRMKDHADKCEDSPVKVLQEKSSVPPSKKSKQCFLPFGVPPSVCVLNTFSLGRFVEVANSKINFPGTLCSGLLNTPIPEVGYHVTTQGQDSWAPWYWWTNSDSSLCK